MKLAVTVDHGICRWEAFVAFEKHKAKEAEETYQSQLQAWQTHRDEYSKLLELARTFNGSSSSDLVLKSGEAVYASVTSTSLIEQHRGRGHYEGASAGVSVPIGTLHGQPVRYRVGANRGHFVAGAPIDSAIDTGTVWITNQRVIFQGTHQTRECDFAKLLGVSHDDRAGTTTISVSNREKPITIHYGPDLSSWFKFRFDLAHAHYMNIVEPFISGVEQELNQLDSEKPQPPATSSLEA